MAANCHSPQRDLGGCLRSCCWEKTAWAKGETTFCLQCRSLRGAGHLCFHTRVSCGGLCPLLAGQQGYTQANHSHGCPLGSLMDTEGIRDIFPANCAMFSSLAIARPNLCRVLQSEKIRKLPKLLETGLSWLLRLMAPGNSRTSKNPAGAFQPQLPAAAAENRALESSAWDVQMPGLMFWKRILQVGK